MKLWRFRIKPDNFFRAFATVFVRTLRLFVPLYGGLIFLRLLLPYLFFKVQYDIGQLVGCGLSAYTNSTMQHLVCSFDGPLSDIIESASKNLFMTADIYVVSVYEFMTMRVTVLWLSVIVSIIFAYPYYRNVKWIRIAPLIVASLMTAFILYALRETVKDRYNNSWFEVRNAVELPDCKAADYRNAELGFVLRTPSSLCRPEAIDAGIRKTVQWTGIRATALAGHPEEYPAFNVTVGTFFGKNGEMLAYDQVASGEAEWPDTKTSVDLEVDGYKARRVDQSDRYGGTWSYVAIQRERTVYLLRSSPKDEMDKVLPSFRFTGKTPVIASVAIRSVTKDEAILLYPSGGSTVSASPRTIIGKLRAGDGTYLDSGFGLNAIESVADNGYHLAYRPGPMRNTEFLLDGKPVSGVYGIPQFPIGHCEIDHKADIGLVRSTDYLYQDSDSTEPLRTKEECLRRNGGEMPPVLFFMNTEAALSPGRHEIRIRTVTGYTTELAFTVGGEVPVPELPDTVRLDDVDNCASGYYYSAKFLRIHLPVNSAGVYYGVSFPQTRSEDGGIWSRRIRLRIDGRTFGMLLPESGRYYFPDELGRDGKPNPWNALYLPLENLVFGDGTPAKPRTSQSHDEYFEIFPMDATGDFPKGYSIPWSTSGSSSCDG